MKRFLSLTLCLAMLCSMVLIVAPQAKAATVIASGTAFSGYVAAGKWTLYDTGELLLTSNSSSAGSMPNFTEAGVAPWYPYRNLITTVTVKGYTSIGNYAFYDLDSLTSVDLSYSYSDSGSYSYSSYQIDTIGSYAFAECASLQEVDMPYVETIGTYAFSNCDSLGNSFSISDSVGSIGANAFYDCDGLTHITIPYDVYTINQSAFSNCSNLSRVTFDTHYSNGYNRLHTIGSTAFSGTALKTITIPYNVSSLAADAFSLCEELTAINVATNNATYASHSGVLYSKDMTSLIRAPQCLEGEYTIPSGVTSISNNAFEDCDKLTAIHFPSTVAGIGSYAFYDCDGLTAVSIPDSVTTMGTYAFYSCDNLTDVTIGNGLTAIPNYAFQYCRKLENLTIGSKVATIGKHAFSYAALTTLVLPSSVTSIGVQAFYCCNALSEVTLPSKLKTIGDGAFYSTAITDVTIPSSVTSINLLDNWRSFDRDVRYTVSNANSYYSSDSNGVLFDKNKTTLYIAPTTISGAYTIPSTVTTIEYMAFNNCDALTDVTIGANVSYIGSKAFYDCDALTDVTIGANVSTIGSTVFSNCDSLKNIRVASGNGYFCTDSYGALYSKDMYTLVQMPYNIYDVYTVPHGVSDIKSGALDVNVSLVLPESIETVESSNSVSHVIYTGTEEQFAAIDGNWGSAKIHYLGDASLITKYGDCGWYCSACEAFLNVENVKHTYTDEYDTECDVCYQTRSASSISVQGEPEKLIYNQFETEVDVTEGVLLVTWENGTKEKIEMTPDMVSGLDVTTEGIKTLTVTFAGCTTTFDIEVVFKKATGLTITELPKTYYYIDQQLDLTGLTLRADYADGSTEKLTADSALGVSTADTSTTGAKTVTVTYAGAQTEFTVYVHESTEQVIDAAHYPESSHNYPKNADETTVFTWDGAQSITLTFNAQSLMEDGYDFLYLYDGADNQLGEYTGSLAGTTVTVNDDTVKIRIVSDGTVTKYGYAFSQISAVVAYHPEVAGKPIKPSCTTPGKTAGTVCSICAMVITPGEEIPITDHSYIDGVCEDCGATSYDSFEDVLANAGAYLKLENEVRGQVSLTADLYVDLNGHDLTGTIITNGYKVYGMDSTTDSYTCKQIGYFNCTDENGKTIVPETHFKSDITGSVKRYLAIEDESGYSFHRFYLGVTHLNLKPGTTGVGYKAVFYGDDMVIEILDADNAFGFTMCLDGHSPVSAWKSADQFVSGKTVSLRLDNFNAKRYGETNLYACVMLQLADGTVIESTTCSMTLRSLVEQLNSSYTTLNAKQLAAIAEMIEANPAMQAWNVKNLYSV